MRSAGIFTRTLSALVIGSAVLPLKAEAGLFDFFNDDGNSAVSRPAPAPQKKVKPATFPTGPIGGAPAAGGGGGELESAKVALGEFRNQPRWDLPILVTRADWTPADEVNFGKFVNQLGKAIAAKKCNTVKSCMQSPVANMYANVEKKGLILYSDCADFPYFLRAYFAYHNGLPFGYVNNVDMNMQPVASLNDLDASLPTKREDNSPYGNTIVSRGGSNVAKAPGAEPNFLDYLSRMFDSVSTRTLRVSPLTKSYNLSDLYPVKVSRAGIGAGTVVHSTGHALMVWNVEPSGVVRVIDAHPDGTVQFKVIQPATFDRSRPDQGLGFYRFRPLHLVGAAQSQGVFYGGKVTGETDQQLFAAGKWSLEQWYGPGANIAPGTVMGPTDYKEAFKSVNFFDYLAKQLRDANVILKADEVVGQQMQTVCDYLQQRQGTVNEATKTNPPTPQLTHPNTLPQDIFGEEDPTWGALSSPGSDSRIRGAVADLLKSAVTTFRQAKAGDKNIKFDGSAQDYVASIRKKLAAMGSSCVVQYTNSVGGVVKLNMSTVLSRLDKLSFDPYDCTEKRWGASGKELATCRDQDPKSVWYNAEKNLRNVIGKMSSSQVATVRSDSAITVQMLMNSALVDLPDTSNVNLGTAKAPIMNLDADFASPAFMDRLTK